MVRSTWSALTKGLSPDDLALITAYRDFCRSLVDAQEEVTSSAVQYRGKRITMHRLTVTTVAQVESTFDLIREACDTVGPGVTPSRRTAR